MVQQPLLISVGAEPGRAPDVRQGDSLKRVPIKPTRKVTCARSKMSKMSEKVRKEHACVPSVIKFWRELKKPPVSSGSFKSCRLGLLISFAS